MTKKTIEQQLSEIENWDDLRTIAPNADKAINRPRDHSRRFLVVFAPKGERFIIKANGARHAAALSDDLARKHKIQTTGADIRPATADDIKAVNAVGEGVNETNE